MHQVRERLKVLLVTADPAPWGLAACYYRALIKSGYETRLHLLFGERSDRLFLNMLTNKVSVLYSMKLKRAQRHLLTEVTRFKPNLIIITKGTELNSDMLDELKEVSRALVFNLYTDSPFVYPGYPELHNHSFSSVIRHYDCMFSFARFLIPVFYLCGATRVECLPFAHDPEIHHPTEVTPNEMAHYQSPIAYLGKWGPGHERWLEMLVPFGLKIWGVQWHHLSFTSPLRKCCCTPRLSADGMGPNMAKVCHASAIIFNLVRAEHGCAHSMKTFEIPACKGFMLSSRTDEQLEYFEEDKCAVYFSHADELLDKVRFYSERDTLRAKIAHAGWERAQAHTYAHRLQKIVDVYRQLR